MEHIIPLRPNRVAPKLRRRTNQRGGDGRRARTNEAVRHGHTLEGGQRSCMAHSDVERAPPFPWRERTRIIYIRTNTYGRRSKLHARLPFHSHSLAPVCECENEVSRTSIPSLLVDGCAPRTPQTQRRLFSGRAGHSRAVACNFVRAASGWTWCATTKVRLIQKLLFLLMLFLVSGKLFFARQCGWDVCLAQSLFKTPKMVFNKVGRPPSIFH